MGEGPCMMARPLANADSRAVLIGCLCVGLGIGTETDSKGLRGRCKEMQHMLTSPEEPFNPTL